jgi:hypothetical protein
VLPFRKKSAAALTHSGSHVACFQAAMLASQLHHLRRLVDGDDAALAMRIADRLDRDLLPRTRLSDDWLVAAIVGPNNAGKSALFNGLVGGDHSPSLPTGAATRRLVAAARPELAEQLTADGAGGRFAIAPWRSREQALESAERPEELLLCAAATMPEGVLLVDAPDFDSIEARNAAAARAVVAAADLVVCVVTKHTYQNAEVVRFLASWLASGRPWIAVYNEQPSADVARAHLAKLASDIGSPPIARFGAPYDHAVAEGRVPLVPADLDGTGRTLLELLGTRETRAQWKAAALAASLDQLAVDVSRHAADLALDAERHERIAAAVVRLTTRAGEELAREALPARPFLAAFAAVVDRRRNRLRRRWHGAVRALTVAPLAVARAFGARTKSPAALEAGLVELEARSVPAAASVLHEELARAVGPAAKERDVDAVLARALDADLSRSADDALAAALAAHRAAPVETAGFQDLCEALVERAIEERGHDRDVQAFMDLATLLPVAAATATVFLTGGFAVDVAIASSGVLTTALLERYSHWFDRGIARDARRLWRRQRGAELGTLLARALLPTSYEPLVQRAAANAEKSRALREWNTKS